MFVIGKFLDFLSQPLHWVALLLCVVVYLRHLRQHFQGWKVWQRRQSWQHWSGRSESRAANERLATRLELFTLLLLLAIGCTTLPDLLLAKLESGSIELTPESDLHSYTGVIILGGALSPGRLGLYHRQSELNGSATRMTSAVALWQRHPQLKLVFTGGEGTVFGTGPSEAERAHAFFRSLGLPDNAVQYESASRSTYENAIYTARMPGIDPKQRWLLLTSAWHMPRAMRTFVHAGWNVTPYPVDFRTGGITPLTEYTITEGAAHWNLALHELLGIAYYRLSGKLD